MPRLAIILTFFCLSSSICLFITTDANAEQLPIEAFLQKHIGAG